MKKISIMLAVLLVFGLDFAVGQNNSNSLIGTWTGKTLLGDTSFTFAADNTVTMNMMGVVGNGTYVVTGNNITMNFTMGGLFQKNILQAQRSGNNLMIDGAVYTKSAQPSEPQTAVEYNNRGAEYENKGDYDLAIADFTQAIKLDPNNAFIYGNRGSAYHSKGDYDRAIADYTQYIKLDPNNVTVYNNRGAAYNDKGDYDRAIADFNQAIKLDPNFANPYRHRAFAHMNKRNFTQARADVNKALQIDPNYENAKKLSEELKQKGY